MKNPTSRHETAVTVGLKHTLSKVKKTRQAPHSSGVSETGYGDHRLPQKFLFDLVERCVDTVSWR
jgi:hypothetical protein